LYIGKTICGLKKRSSDHIKDSFYEKSNEYNTKIGRAIRKYGPDNIEWEVMVDDIDEDKLDQVEMDMIKQFDSKVNGYNSTLGGSGAAGLVISEESKRKMSATRKQRYKDNPSFIKSGEENGQAKLTWNEVRLIREEYRTTGISHELLADKYGVSRRAIGHVLNNRTWRDLDYDGNTSGIRKDVKLSDEIVEEIRSLYLTGEHTANMLAERFGVCFQNIYLVLINDTHKDDEYEKSIVTVRQLMLRHRSNGKGRRVLTEDDKRLIKELFLAGKDTKQIYEAISHKVTVGAIRGIVHPLRSGVFSCRGRKHTQETRKKLSESKSNTYEVVHHLRRYCEANGLSYAYMIRISKEGRGSP
jgi:hypothetical protein